VRRGLARAGAASGIALHPLGIGPAAADAAAQAALTASEPPARVLVAGLCGALSATLDVGDVLFYSTLRDTDGTSVATDAALTARLLDTVPSAQSGIRALSTALIVVDAAEKAQLAQRYDVDAVDMESLALVQRLGQAGSSVAVLRVVSDSVDDDLPDLNAAVSADGALSSGALLAASLKRPFAALRMARNGARALAALERALSVTAQAR